MLLLAKGSYKTPGAQNRYDVFFRKGYEVSDITEVLGIQIENVSRPVSEVRSSDPSITASMLADVFWAPQAWRRPVAEQTKSHRGAGSSELVFSHMGLE